MATSPTETPTSTTIDAYRAWALVSLLRLRWFIRLRWVFVLAAFAVLALEHLVIANVRRPWQLGMLVTGVAVINLLWTAASRFLQAHFRQADADQVSAIASARVFAIAQVTIDLVLLTLILRFTGGIENPMMLFYVFHIAIGALLLTKWQATLQALWAVILFAGLCLGELSGALSPHYSFLSGVESPGWYADAHFVIVGTIVHACGVFGVLYFTLQIAARLDKRDRQLRVANEALRQSQKAIQDLQTRRSRFMQTAAHQLKSPLAVIQTLASLIRDEIVPLDNIEPTTEKIVQRCRDGIGQVTELLTLARVQEASPERHQEALANLAEVVSDLCRRHRTVAQSKDVMLTWQLPEDPDLWVSVDPRDANDCIANLIENAIKYTPGPGSVSVKVGRIKSRRPRHNASTPRPRSYVYVSVRDTGIGIEPDALPKSGSGDRGSLFDAFRRGNSAVAAGIPGTGLGLSIVREVVERAGGRIIAYSRLGKGSTFTVLFPCADGLPDGLTG